MFRLAGKLVSRLGLGTMGLTGPGTWGTPADPFGAVQLLRSAVDDHGITHFDTADAYGPHTAEELVHRALYPYPERLLIATKVGMVRPAPNVWRPLGNPDYLRATVEQSLRRLGTDCLDLCYLHRNDPAFPFLDQVGTLADLQQEGKIAHIGLSKVGPEEINEAATVITVAAVQNKLSQAVPDDAAHGAEHCRARGIPYIAYAPLGSGALAEDGGVDAALRWLLELGDHIAPIPGTSSPAHLNELVKAASHT
ncbi:aldo/keto reductase [Streptomyces sp. ISL-87]|nr:aldo/keto reductase [Streptomyces sp. ISL-87]